MSERISASLTVSFNSSSTSSAGLVLEIDDREDGLNHGKTDFRPGDSVYYLLYKADDITITHHLLTSGSKSAATDGQREMSGNKADIITFTDSNNSSLKYPASSGVNFSWIGRSERTDGESSGVSISLGDDQQTVNLSGNVVGMLKCEYSANYSAFKLSGVPLDIDSCLIWVAGTR